MTTNNNPANIDAEDEFGTAQIDAEFEGYKFFKLRSPDPKKGEQQTEFICRLLPPMKSYKATGKWAFFYGQHYGHAGVNSRDPSKPRSRPFGCIQEKNNRTGEIIKRCPKCDQLAAARARVEAREHDLKRANASLSEEALKEVLRNDHKLKAERQWLSDNNCDKKFWMNVMALDGSFGVLQLSYKTFNNKLKPKLREWSEKERIDAFDLSKGVWIRFTRTGQKLAVEDGVDLYMESVDIGNGRTAKMHKEAPLSPEQRQRAGKVCPDLALEAVKMLTAEKIQALVDCSGDPSEVDLIWDGPKQPDQATGGADVGEPDDVDEAVEGASGEPEPAPASQLSAEDEEAALLERARLIQERKAREAAAAASTTASMAVSGDPSEDFLSKFQPKQ